MTSDRRAVTIMIHRDGAVESSTYRIPVWALRATAVGGIAVAFLVLIAVAFYGPIVKAAARVPFLTRKISPLNADNEQVRQLPGRPVEMEAPYAEVRAMRGAGAGRQE